MESELVSRGTIWGSGSSEILVKILSCENDRVWNLYQSHEDDLEELNTTLRIEKMRNLRNVLYENWEPPAQFRGRLLTASTWDLANDSVLCTVGPTETDALIELVRITTKSTSQYASSRI